MTVIVKEKPIFVLTKAGPPLCSDGMTDEHVVVFHSEETKHVTSTQREYLLTICQRATLLGLYLFILFLPCSIAISQTGLGLLSLCYLVESALRRRFAFPRLAINPPLLGYLAVMALTTLFAVDVGRSIKSSEDIFVVVVVYLLYVDVTNLTRLHKLIKLLALIVTLAAVYGGIQHFLEIDLFRLSRPISFLKHVNNDLTAPVRVPGFFSSYMTFSGQLAMMIPILTALLFAGRTRLKQLLWGLALGLVGLALLWTYTRSAWVGAAGALALMGYLRGRRVRIVLLIALLVLAALVMMQPELAARLVSIVNAEQNLERLYTWESTLAMIRDHLWTGIGKGNYRQLAPAYRAEYALEFTSRAHAHNNILQVAVEGGIVALLCFLWLWVVIFRELYRAYRRIPESRPRCKWLALGCLGAAAAFFGQGVFEWNFGDSESAMMLWALVAFALKLDALAADRTKGAEKA